jgi:hypothetical protein
LWRQESTQRNAPPGLRPHTPRLPSPILCLRGSAEGPSLSLRRTHEIPLVPLRARSSSALGARLGQGGEKQRQRLRTQPRKVPRRFGQRKVPKNTYRGASLISAKQAGVCCFAFTSLFPPSTNAQHKRRVKGVFVFLLSPLTQAEGGGRAKSKHEVAGHGPPRSPQAQGRAG